MAESSSHNTSSPEITPKEEPVTLDKPKSPNPFLLATQVEFTFEEIAFTTNNEVALLYPSHPNQEYFKDASNFISKCCLKEAFTRAPTQYKEYLSEFWYTTNTLEDSKVWVSTPTGGVRGDIGYNGEIGAKGTLIKSCLPPRWSLAKDKSPSHPSPPTLVVGEMYKEAQQAAGGPTSLRATSEERAHPQLSSDKTKYARDGLKTAHTNSGTNEESRADDISKKIKLKDLSEFLKDTRSTFFTPDPPQDEPIIVTDESEEEDADKEETYDTSHDMPEDTSVLPTPSLKSSQIQELMAQVQFLKSQKDELEQQKAIAEAEVTSLKARPLYPNVNQLTTLLVTSLKPELSKLLASHNFASCLPTELKELPSKFTELSGEIKELKQHVKDMEIELPGDLKENPTKLETFTSTISSLTSQKNTKDADINLKDELVDLLGTNVVTQYYNKKLLFDKYCDKILKIKKSPKITNCEVLKKKGPVTLKIYREDGSEEVILNLKVLRILGSICTLVYAAVQKLKKDSWKELQFSLVDNSKLNVVYLFNRNEKGKGKVEGDLVARVKQTRDDADL
ncbi:hypothetical protein Tco_1173322 [Tanacetum coccineum]